MRHLCFRQADAARALRRVLAGLALSSLLVPQKTPASGVVTNCTDANLRAALAGGGLVTFACDGTIVLTNTLLITNDTSLDASGHSVSLSGGNAIRLLVIQPGVKLTMKRLTLAEGRAGGTNGATSQPGGPGEGGAVYNNGGTLSATDCAFQRSKAVGGLGGRSGGKDLPAGAGGTGAGGAIFSSGGDNFLTNVSFVGNRALGGNGGISPQPGVIGSPSGPACGGAIYLSGGMLFVHNGRFTDNGAAFGNPGQGFRSGLTTGVAGGAVCSLGAHAVFAGSSFLGNACGHGVDSPTVSLGGNASGGAIFHHGDRLSLTDTLFLNNRAMGGPTFELAFKSFPGGEAFGGALFIDGAGAITNCTLAGNMAEGGPFNGGLGAPCGSGWGGAIYNQSTLDLLNTTLFGNAARGGEPSLLGGGSGLGGGLCNSGGVVRLQHVTLAGNLARGSETAPGSRESFSLGGGLFSTNGEATIRNTIIANSPSGGNGFGSFIDGGHNISSDSSFDFSSPGSLNDTDPVLGPLADYGGPVSTMALLAGSPALDAADPKFCSSTDQRGIARPYGAGCDIGAFESAPPYTILGQVQGFTTPARGIQVAASAISANVPPGGQFILHGFPPGKHLLSIASPECVFNPGTLSVTVGPDVVDVSFFSYRSNALVMERLPSGGVRCVFVGEVGATYRVLSGTDLSALTPSSTNQAQADGLFEFTVDSDAAPYRFFRVVRP